MKQLIRATALSVAAVALFSLASPWAMGATRTFDFQGAEFGTPDSACVDNPAPPLFNRPGYAVQTGSKIVSPAACGEGQLGGTLGNDSLLTAGIGGTNTNELRFSWLDPTLADQWARIAAYAAGGVTPKFVMPTVDIRPGSSVTMKIWAYTLDATGVENTAGQLEFALAIRETGQNLPLGENGGTSGTVEFVGVTNVTAATAPKGGTTLNDDGVNYYLVKWTFKADNTKVDVSVNGGAAVEKSVLAFAGDGALSAAFQRAAIDSLVVIKPDADTVTKTLFVNVDDVVIDAPGITDPVQVEGPILQTSGRVNVKSINADASAVKLYRNGVLSGSQTFTPGSAPSSYLFTPQTTNVGDVFTATQVVGAESDASAGVTVSSVVIMSENFDGYADQAAFNAVWKRKSLLDDYGQPGSYPIGGGEEVALSGLHGATCPNAAMIPGSADGTAAGRYVAVAQIPGAGSTGFDGSDAIPLNLTMWVMLDDVSQGRNEVGLLSLTNHNVDTGRWKAMCSIGVNNNYPAGNRDRFQARTLAGSGTYYDLDQGPDGAGAEVAFRQPGTWVKMQIRVKTTTVQFLINDKVYKIAARPSPSSTYDSILLGNGLRNSSQACWVDSITVSYGDPIVEQYPGPVAMVGGVTGPVKAGGTAVTINGISLAADTSADAIKVFADGVLFAQAPANGTNTLVMSVPPLVKDQKLTVTQKVGGVESCPSPSVTVGSGTNAAGVRLAIGIRENTALTGPVGGNGGTAGSSIEWLGVSTKVNGAPQGKLITPSADWQTVEFVPGTDPVLAFSGGDSVLNGTYGVLEHLAITTTGTDTGNYVLYIDNVENDGVTFGTFDSYATGSAAMFQHPTFSGSTSDDLLTAPNLAVVDDTRADGGSGKSVRVEWQWVDLDGGRWIRLTTAGNASLVNLPNPIVNLSKPIRLRVLLLPAGPSCYSPQSDLNGDSSVDGADYGLFAGCFNGTGNPFNAGCECADLNGDLSVDGADYGLFAGCFNGTGNPSPCM